MAHMAGPPSSSSTMDRLCRLSAPSRSPIQFTARAPRISSRHFHLFLPRPYRLKLHPSTLPRHGPLLSRTHLNVRRLPVSAGFSPALKPEKRAETDFLPSDVRERTMRAVDELGGRVTVGDVAGKAGIKISQADTALQAIATDCGGFLEVSDEGDVLYVFPKDYRTTLAAKSFRLKIEPFLEKFKAVGDYLIRVTFGTTLLASILLVYSTLMVLLTTSRSENDNRNQGSQRSYNSGFTFYISPADLFWYWDPYYYRRRRIKSGGLNFFESVFSFVFGDGDPNEESETLRWKLIGEYIRSKGGVVCAEELAPFLDVPSLEESRDLESLMLPVLLRFDGEPEVDSMGNIIYRFPSLQRTAFWARQRNTFNDIEPFKEERWQFSKADQGDQVMVIGLGAFNLIGVLILSTWLRDISVVGRYGVGLVPFVAKLLPILQLYTASFFAIPTVRWFLLQKRNSEIDKKNAARFQWLEYLQRPDLLLKKKLESTWNLAKQTVIGRDQIIYSTAKDFSDQDFEAQDWEQRFRDQQAR